MSAWDGIDEFVAVATAGNFSRAAKAMGASTTHLSRAVMRLESRIQIQLFHRTTRTVRLTEAGITFLEQCRKIVEERDDAIAQISQHGDPEGVLRITCSTFMGERFVAPILRKFAMAYPKINITLSLTNRLVDLVAEGFDLAVRTGALADSRLIGTRIGSRALLTCASPAYLAKTSRPHQISDLDTHQCVLGSSEQWHFKQRGKDTIFRPKGQWRCDSGTVVLDSAISGMGICQLPDFYLLPHIRDGSLEVLLEKFRPDDEPVWAIYPQRRHLPSKVTRLIALLKNDLPLLLRCD